MPLTDDDLPPLRAGDKTHWHALHGVHLRKSPKPVELELRWVYSDDFVTARRKLALSDLEGDALDRESVKLIAQLLVVDWRHVPNGQGGDEPYTAEDGAKLLAHVRAQAPDIWGRLEIALGNPENYGRPKLVDAEALGKA